MESFIKVEVSSSVARFRTRRKCVVAIIQIDHTIVWSIFALDFGLGRGYSGSMRNNDADGEWKTQCY